MITQTGTKEVTFTINEEDLIESISLLTSLKDFCKEQTQEEEGKEETVRALTVAIETMQAFWCEKFGEDEKDE